MAAKIGDTVRFLNDIGGGVIVKIKDNMAYVADDDGFETPILLRECVVVGQASQTAKKVEAVVSPRIPENAVPSKSTDATVDAEPVEETDGGDVLNIVLAFEAHDLRHLSLTGFDAYLVNDSNYYLYFTFMTKPESDAEWMTRYAGVVEPNFQLLLTELSTADLPEIDRIAVQFVAFKRDKAFELKAPIAFESRFDSSKFARLHCFHSNVYFDDPVIAYDIVKDDVAQRGAYEIGDAIAKDSEKAPAEAPKSRPVKKHHTSVKAQKNADPLVVDLHIGELIDDYAGLSNADILNYQIDRFRETMDENMRFGGKKIIFIHGKGEGVLRQALLKELNYRYKNCDVQDASFREYGYGATQVIIGSRPKKL